MQLTKREWSRHAGAALALALLFGFLGPFGSQQAYDRPSRYAFWLGLTLFGYVCTLAAFVLVEATPRLAILRPPARIVLAAMISSVPQMLAVAWTITLLQPRRRFEPADLPALFAAVLAVQLVLAFAAFALNRRAPAPAVSPTSPKFLERLPPHVAGDLIALEAQDHYLKVHTDRGAHMLLMRLSDAAAQLSGQDGLQVHRGWWVAADAVTRTETRSGRTALHLTNGLTVPVSRTYLQAVRAKGWAVGG
jgi:DNA-binding LytR/AlgR family response regulator